MVHTGVHQHAACGVGQGVEDNEQTQMVGVKWWEINFWSPSPMVLLSRAESMMNDYCTRQGYNVLGYLAEFEPRHKSLARVGVRYDVRKLPEGG